MKVLFIVLLTYLSLMGLLFTLMLIFRKKTLELISKIQKWLNSTKINDESEDDLMP